MLSCQEDDGALSKVKDFPWDLALIGLGAHVTGSNRRRSLHERRAVDVG